MKAFWPRSLSFVSSKKYNNSMQASGNMTSSLITNTSVTNRKSESECDSGRFLPTSCASATCLRIPLKKYMLKWFMYLWIFIELYSSQVVDATSDSDSDYYRSGRIRWESLSSLATESHTVYTQYESSTKSIPLNFLQAAPDPNSVSELDSPLLSLNPQIHSPQLKLTVQKGARVLLPCKIHNLGENHILWRHRLNILAGSNVSTYADDRIQLHSDFTLEIRRVSFEDAGDYECMVTTWPQLKIIHSLTIQDAPTLHVIPATGSVETTEGETVEIECIPNGNPKPRIFWTMRNGTIPLHPAFLNQTKLTFPNVTPRFSGLYVCTADNGVGRPAFGAVYVRVIYAPVIDTPKRRVHGGIRARAQLTCVIDADPKAEVHWRLGHALVSSSERVSTQIEGSVYRLVFNTVREYDFGIYSCEANNSIGYNMKLIEFSGVPNAPIVNSWTTATWHDDDTDTERVQVTLFWVVECYSSLIDYRLMLRAAPLKPPITSSNEDKTPAWTEITVPADSSSAFLHTKSFPIRGLQAGSIYEAVIKARNKFGWSPVSSVCYFSTFPNTSSAPKEDVKERFQELNAPDSVVFISKWEHSLPGQPGDGEDLDYSLTTPPSSANIPKSNTFVQLFFVVFMNGVVSYCSFGVSLAEFETKALYSKLFL